jgi:hypothetical protein
MNQKTSDPASKCSSSEQNAAATQRSERKFNGGAPSTDVVAAGYSIVSATTASTSWAWTCTVTPTRTKTTVRA